MNPGKLEKPKALMACALCLCMQSVEAQTLEHSIAPSLTAQTLKLSPPQLPVGDVSESESESEPQPTNTFTDLANEEIPELLVEGTESEAGFGIADFESAFEGMLSRKKITGAIVGTTISAALSAHPVGAFLGGLVGAMVGKESKYKPQQAPQSTFTQGDLFSALERQNKAPVAEAPAITETSKVVLTARTEKTPQGPSDHCYRMRKNSAPRNRASLQNCFYYMH